MNNNEYKLLVTQIHQLLDTQLIQLSHIFKNGFKVKIIDNKITQYDITDSPYEDRIKYKVLIEIKKGKPIFKNGKIPDVCIIKGWSNIKSDIYYIALQL